MKTKNLAAAGEREKIFPRNETFRARGRLLSYTEKVMTFQKAAFAALAAVVVFSVPRGNAAEPEASSALPSREIRLKEVTGEDVRRVVRVGPALALGEAVPLALRNNLGVAVARREKASVAETPNVALADFDPNFSFSSTYGNTGEAYWERQRSGASEQNWANRAELSKKFSSGAEATLYGAFNRAYNTTTDFSPASGSTVGLEISQPLLSGFGEEINLAPLVKARKNVTQSALSLRKTTLDLILDAEVAYWNLSASYALVGARLSSLRHAEFVLEQAKKRRALKDATKEDVLQAEADVASRRVNLVVARQSVQDCDDALRKILGETGDDDSGTYAVAELSEDVPAETRTFAEWIAAVREFDIDAQIQEIEREKAELDVRVAADADRPSLALVLGAEASGRESSPAKSVTGVADRTGYDLSAGIRFSVPLGFRREKAELRRAELAREQAEIAVAQALQNAMFDARSAWRASEAARERLASAKVALSMQKEAYAGQIARYGVGKATMTDVLSAQDALDSARLDLIQAALDVVTSRAKVQRLDGEILAANGFSWREIDDAESASAVPAAAR